MKNITIKLTTYHEDGKVEVKELSGIVAFIGMFKLQQGHRDGGAGAFIAGKGSDVNELLEARESIIEALVEDANESCSCGHRH